MARQFIYDSVGFSEATIKSGTFSGSSTKTFSDTGGIASIERIADQNISIPITASSFGQYETMQIDLGSAQSSNAIALYHTSADTNDLVMYASNHATQFTSGDSVTTLSTDHPANDWNVFAATVSSKRYIYIYNGTANNYDYLSEMIIGSKYTFDVNPELNSKIGEEFGTDVVTSYGGNEYANKRHAPKTTWDFTFSHILSTQKTALEALNANVQDWKKFIYYDDNAYHYVRLVKPIEFTEVAPNVFSANVSLREQLA
tara:strand:- start:388 stop:1161 length:774 start_codon:yes stop_codon:yes gene_type:complete